MKQINESHCPRCNQIARHGYCATCDYDFQADYSQKQNKAIAMVGKAIKVGLLTRPDVCELCGSVTLYGRQVFNYKNEPIILPGKHNRMVAHHYAGYEEENVLKVWWLCHRCNMILSGKKFHNGTVSKEEARSIVLERMKLDHKVQP